jgi:hypothetical protein
MKRLLLLVFLVTAAAVTANRSALAQGEFKVSGAPLERSWGPVKGAYFDMRHGEPRLVLEEPSGKVRIVAIHSDGSTAMVQELKRD